MSTTQLIKQFIKTTNATNDEAVAYLKKSPLSLQNAVNLWFTHKELAQVFRKYTQENEMNLEQFLVFLGDLELDPGDSAVLVLLYTFGAKQMGVVDMAGFLDGLTKLECSDMKSLKKMIPTLAAQFHTQQVYMYTFDLLKTGKSIMIESAVPYFHLFFPDYAHIGEWTEFLKDRRGVSRDVWNLFFEFSKIEVEEYDVDGNFY